MPTIFIRYNPDKYKPKNNDKMMSDTDREIVLIKYLKACTKLKPENELESLRILHLFYDDYDKATEYKPMIIDVPSTIKTK